MDSLESKFEAELTATEKLAQFEKEKLSRRQALARIGFQAGAAAIAALTADELLRKVGKEMQRRAGDNKVADQVAKEFVNAGVANAIVLDPDIPIVPPCIECVNRKASCLHDADVWLSGCLYGCNGNMSCIITCEFGHESRVNSCRGQYDFCCDLYNCNC